MMTMNATYSPEDNKLRLYASSRIDTDTYNRLKEAGFKWAGKQAEAAGVGTLMVAPRWTIAREDLLLELCGEIGDEDYSPTERSADRAERFEGYREKRSAEAHDHANTFEHGPSAFGHQNRARAERQAARHDRHRGRAYTQWEKAEYWQERTRAVIAHALFKTSPSVRRGRIKEIETERRKLENTVTEYRKRFNSWRKVLDDPSADLRIEYRPDNERAPGIYGTLAADSTECARLAYGLAYLSHDYGRKYKSPRDGAEGTLYDLIGPYAENPISPREAAALWLESNTDPDDPRLGSNRWLAHYANRLEYERAMLANEGGSAAEIEIEPGGWIRGGRTHCALTDASKGWKQIHKVNRSNTTGRVVSVAVEGTYTGYTKESGYTKQETRPCMVNINVERMAEDAYRAPTDEERAAFAEAKKEKKAAAPTIPTINPTRADADRLQAHINDLAAETAKKRGRPRSDRAVEEMTQLQFSQGLKHERTFIKTFDLGGARFKVRMRHRGFTDYQAPDSVVVLTDKPQKPLPIDWATLGATQATTETAEPVEAFELV